MERRSAAHRGCRPRPRSPSCGAARARRPRAAGWLALQGAAGNRAVGAILGARVPAAAIGAQAKLTIGAAGDRFEQEADRVADAIADGRDAAEISRVGSIGPGAAVVRRACACSSGEGTCPTCREQQLLQRKGERAAEAPADLTARIEARQGAGSPLAQGTRGAFEARLGHDLGGVRVHADDEAARLSGSLGAAAFTMGRDIFFGAGRFQPETPAGRHLLAHELVHAVQQGATSALHGEALRLQRLEHPRIQKLDDASYEAASGLHTALTATPPTMTASGVQGTTSIASGCPGTPEALTTRLATVAGASASGAPFGGFMAGVATACSVSFRFEKAMVGDYPYVAAGRDVRGAYVKIVMTPTPGCGTCNSLEIIQAVTDTAPGTGGAVVPARPDGAVREARAGWNDPRAPSRGWGIDRIDSATVPVIGTSNAGDATHPAVLWDAPGDWATRRSAGSEFRTCLMCTRTGRPRVALGCVTWGYFIDASGSVAFRPPTPVATCGTATEACATTPPTVRDAIPGNTAVNLAP